MAASRTVTCSNQQNMAKVMGSHFNDYVTTHTHILSIYTYIHTYMYGSVLLECSRDSPADSKKARCYDVNCGWRGPHGWELWMASRCWGLLSYNCNELNSTKTQWIWKRTLNSKWKCRPGQHFDCSLRRPWAKQCLFLLTLRNCETMATT